MCRLVFTKQVNVHSETCIPDRRRIALERKAFVNSTMITSWWRVDPTLSDLPPCSIVCMTSQDSLPTLVSREGRIEQSTLKKEVGPDWSPASAKSPHVLLGKSLTFSDPPPSPSLKWGWWLTWVLLNSSLQGLLCPSPVVLFPSSPMDLMILRVFLTERPHLGTNFLVF